jgi:hypothetical protein
LFAAPTVEVELEHETEIIINVRSPGWTKHLPSNSLIPIPSSYRGYYFDITIGDRRQYHFCAAVGEDEFDELIELLTQNDSVEPMKPSGLRAPDLE